MVRLFLRQGARGVDKFPGFGEGVVFPKVIEGCVCIRNGFAAEKEDCRVGYEAGCGTVTFARGLVGVV